MTALKLSLIVLLVLGVSSASVGPSWAEPLRVDRTLPNHLGPKGVEPIEPPPPAGHVYQKLDVLAYRLPEAATKWAKLDTKLSHLCRLGAFRQQRPKALYAFAPGITYGVAFAEGANLYDTQHLAKPGDVYFFAEFETSNCIVLRTAQGKVAPYSTSKFGSPAPSARAGK